MAIALSATLWLAACPPQSPEGEKKDWTGVGLVQHAPEWSITLTGFTYFTPQERNFGGGAVKADRAWLHLEGRFNYEDLNTGSLFAGWNFAFGSEVEFKATPMVGAVFGETDGVAPAYVVRVGWKRLELYTEGEYVFDLHESDDSFFYSWSEVSLRPLTWLRLGAAVERSPLLVSDSDVHAGPLAGVRWRNVEFSVVVFTAGVDDPVTAVFIEAVF